MAITPPRRPLGSGCLFKLDCIFISPVAKGSGVMDFEVAIILARPVLITSRTWPNGRGIIGVASPLIECYASHVCKGQGHPSGWYREARTLPPLLESAKALFG
jgi:hypothetical protein